MFHFFVSAVLLNILLFILRNSVRYITVVVFFFFTSTSAVETRFIQFYLTCNRWKLYPVRQSQKHMVPLSAPDTITPSGLTQMLLMIALWPGRFWMKFPSGHFHCLILSGDAEANMYLKYKKIIVIKWDPSFSSTILYTVVLTLEPYIRFWW